MKLIAWLVFLAVGAIFVAFFPYFFLVIFGILVVMWALSEMLK